MTPPFRRVTVMRDLSAKLFYLRCVQGCLDGEFCMDMEPLNHGQAAKLPSKMGCWLGSSLTVQGAEAMAKRSGYEVVA